jgi:hypothetical protein
MGAGGRMLPFRHLSPQTAVVVAADQSADLLHVDQDRQIIAASAGTLKNPTYAIEVIIFDNYNMSYEKGRSIENAD